MPSLTIRLPEHAAAALHDLAQAECRTPRDQASLLVIQGLRAALPAPRRRVTWTADRDGEAHATIAGRVRTSCGRRPIEPRFAWPETQPRCPVCLAAAEEVAPAKRR